MEVDCIKGWWDLTYETLLIKADTIGVTVKEFNLKTRDGHCKENRIAINKNLSTKEKTCVLAEELAHYHLTVGDITDQENISNKKQELKARRYSYDILLEPIDIVNAMRIGCVNRFEITEYLHISEEFFEELIEDYKKQYGIGIFVGNYYLQLEPCLVLIKDFGGLFEYKNINNLK